MGINILNNQFINYKVVDKSNKPKTIQQCNLVLLVRGSFTHSSLNCRVDENYTQLMKKQNHTFWLKKPEIPDKLMCLYQAPQSD